MKLIVGKVTEIMRVPDEECRKRSKSVSQVLNNASRQKMYVLNFTQELLYLYLKWTRGWAAVKYICLPWAAGVGLLVFFDSCKRVTEFIVVIYGFANAQHTIKPPPCLKRAARMGFDASLGNIQLSRYSN